MKKSILSELERRVLIYDGAMGTLLQEAGLEAGGCPETFTLSNPDVIRGIHRSYVEAGADVLETNTFGANRLKLREYGLEDKIGELNERAARLARDAAGERAWVAGAIGPLGRLLQPLGDLSWDEAVELFSEQAAALRDGGVDLILIETVSDIREAKAAVAGVLSVCDLPVQVQLTFDEGGTNFTGSRPAAAAVTLEAAGVHIIGSNCGTGPADMLLVLEEMARVTGAFISALSNAGIPELEDGRTVFRATPSRMADFAERCFEIGVGMVGGCCGTTPAHIRAMMERVGGRRPRERQVHAALRLSSRSRIVEVAEGTPPLVAGERINPTARKRMSRELQEGKMTSVRADAIEQVRCGAELLDVNVGVAGGDEAELMGRAVLAVQNVVDVPILIDSPNPRAVEAGLKRCEGKPLINSVSGHEESLREILPLAKKYGAALLALTVDESGIPSRAEGRVDIARKIVERAGRVGISPNDIIVDCVNTTVSASQEAVMETLKAVRMVKELGYRASLGVSNVSFGLPRRELMNAAFLPMALAAGLDLAMVNPMRPQVMDAFSASCVLTGRDRDALRYIERFRPVAVSAVPPSSKPEGIRGRIFEAVLLGEVEAVGVLVEDALREGVEPMEINLSVVSPALREVGRRFERKEYFLPQMMLSAETVQAAFRVLKRAFRSDERPSMGKILLATVEGDVHDIGKNICCIVLENHGYEVIDLGRNVSCGTILKEASEREADLIGLSALMTTTMPRMGEVIEEIRRLGLSFPVMVGGAAVTPGFAERIGSAGYARDAGRIVGIVEKILREKAPGPDPA